MNYPRLYAEEQGFLINLVGKNGQAVQISIHAPSRYICANRERILTDWREVNSFWVVLVLQQAKYPLVKSTPEIEREKEYLREKFMRFGCDLAFNLRDRGYLADLIDPRSGYPLLSRPGAIPHDDTAAVKALLNYPVLKNKCSVIVHPTWATAIYPSTFVCSAPPMIIEWAVKSTAPMHGWEEGLVISH